MSIKLQDSIIALKAKDFAVSKADAGAAFTVDLPAGTAVSVSPVLVGKFLFASALVVMKSALALALPVGKFPGSFYYFGRESHLISLSRRLSYIILGCPVLSNL